MPEDSTELEAEFDFEDYCLADFISKAVSASKISNEMAIKWSKWNNLHYWWRQL